MPFAMGGTFLRAALFVSVAGAAWAHFLRNRTIRFEVSGESMAPRIRHGDFLVIDALAYAHRSPARGDIVVVPDPRFPGRPLVKRILAFDPRKGIWVQGDNERRSTDSRTFGWLDPDEVIGRVVVRYWPNPRWFR